MPFLTKGTRKTIGPFRGIPSYIPIGIAASLTSMERGHRHPTTNLEAILSKIFSPRVSAIWALAANMTSPIRTPLGQFTSQLRHPIQEVTASSNLREAVMRPSNTAPARVSLPRATLVSSLVIVYVGHPAIQTPHLIHLDISSFRAAKWVYVLSIRKELSQDFSCIRPLLFGDILRSAIGNHL